VNVVEVLAAVLERQQPQQPLDRLRLLVAQQLHEQAVPRPRARRNP
jgi:hypothetical protein